MSTVAFSAEGARSMDVTFNNVLEGTRQYFMGLPKQAQAEGGAQPPGWPTQAEDPAPAQTGAPAPSSRPPSTAAASAPALPRPPSEPLEPEPHIIHKATVMREAAEKRREQPSPADDEDDPAGELSPPPHIIRKPPHTLPSPAPAQHAPSPSPSRPPSAAAPPPTAMSEIAADQQFRPSMHRVHTPTQRPPDHYATSRPPDPYSASRPPEPYQRYHYDLNAPESGRVSHGNPAASPQPSAPRQSPQTYARLSSALPQHSATRLREATAPASPVQRYPSPVALQPHNDRVPPIHHPHVPQPAQRPPSVDARSAQYTTLTQRRETSPYGRHTHYERHPTLPTRKFDHQQAYPGYRPTQSASQPVSGHRIEPPYQIHYKHAAVETASMPYAVRAPERAPPAPQSYPQESVRHSVRTDYPTMSRSQVDARSGYHYPTPSTSTLRYGHGTSNTTPTVQSSTPQSRSVYRPPTGTGSKGYEYPTSNHIQTSPARATSKPVYPSQPARMTVSVTSLVNQMNQTKQKRESPLDLSVKTVKNSADSSTTQDDMIDSVSMENKSLMQPRIPSNSRNPPAAAGYVESHKVDFAPDFSRFGRDRTSSHSYVPPTQQTYAPVRPNGAHEAPRNQIESFPKESRHPHHTYPDRNKFNVSRTDLVPRIDLTTRTITADDRRSTLDTTKRPAGPILSNIPEKIVRYETWTSDSRIDRLNQSAREQQELISRPVYSYSSHKQFEAFQNEQKRPVTTGVYPQSNHRYSYPTDQPPRERTDFHVHYHDRTPSSSSRHIIQKNPSHRDVQHYHHHHHHHHLDSHSTIPADKRVLSILRNSLETKQAGLVEQPVRSTNQVTDVIVLDDVDDSVIEITDLTEEVTPKVSVKPTLSHITTGLGHHIQMPKAVDSIPRDSEYQQLYSENNDSKSKSPENDVASRIRTKAELKVMPPSDSSVRTDLKSEESLEKDKVKLLPKSQKQHLFNQIRQDNLRLESIVKTEKKCVEIPEVKSEPMSIEEIEKDAVIPIKTENILENLEPGVSDGLPGDDLDWASACDTFMEQLKTGVHKKKTQRKRADTVDRESIGKLEKSQDVDHNSATAATSQSTAQNTTAEEISPIVIKQEPLDEDEINTETVSVGGNSTQKIDKLETMTSVVSEDLNKKDETVQADVMEDKLHAGNEKLKHKISKELTNNKIKHKEQMNSRKRSKDDLEKLKPKFRKSLAQSTPKTKDHIKTRNSLNSTPQKLVEKRQNKIKKSANTSESENIKKKLSIKSDRHKNNEMNDEINRKRIKDSKKQLKTKVKTDTLINSTLTIKKEKDVKDKEKLKTVIKEELESTDDDEPLIKSKLLKEKEHSDRMKYQLLKDLSEKSAYVKLECFDVDMNKNTRISIDSLSNVSISKDKDEKQSKGKLTRHTSKSKGKSSTNDSNKDVKLVEESGSDSDDVDIASRLRLRRNIKTEDSKTISVNKSLVKSSPIKKLDNSNISINSTQLCKPGFGDGSDFHPGWEEELYRYKRSLRMPARLIAIPRGRSGGPFVRGSSSLFNRGTTSLPDLDPAPLSPAPSSAQSAATDDLFARRPDKLTLDSDLDSNSSCSAPHKLHYDSEASTSTVFSINKVKKKGKSIVDVLIQKCGRKDESKKKSKEDNTPKVIPKSSNTTELLATPSLGLLKNESKGNLSAKKEKLMEDIFYLGAFRKETVTAFRNAFIKNTDGLIGATEEFAPVVLKSRTRTESRVLKQRATIKEVFGDERPASAPPTSCREIDDLQEHEVEQKPIIAVECKDKELESKLKLKSKKIMRDKLKRRSSSIRDGLRSTKSLKMNDAKGRLMRLKKRNSLMKSLANKRIKEMSGNKIKKEKSPTPDDSKDTPKEESNSTVTVEGNSKRRLKRLFGRRKFSSGFDYIRKKKKIIRRDDTPKNKIRRPAVKPSPESVHDIRKEIKSWFINKSVGETHLHRAARLGYTDCIAYCLEKMDVDPSAKDNAGFTPLHVAAAKGHVRIARLLLQYGANVSAAAQGGIRPLHEASENCHVEVMRLLLAYGADPLLGTYAGQTPEDLTEGPAASLLRLHIDDVQGRAVQPWRFPPPTEVIDKEELGCDPLASPPPASPPPPPDSMVEFQCTEVPLPPFYSLRPAPGQPAEGLWCLLQDITNLLQIKSKESLLKQIHCGSGSPKELYREIRTQEFLERAQCHQLLGAGEKVNVRASKVSLIRVTDKLRQLLKIETVLVS